MALTGDWDRSEVEALVQAYACMLRHQAAGEPYVKAHHNKWVEQATGRGRGAIEFKFCNLSADLLRLEHGIVLGYLPRFNSQKLLHDVALEFIEGKHPLPSACILETNAESRTGHCLEASPSEADMLTFLQSIWPLATGGQDVAAQPGNAPSSSIVGRPAAGLEAAAEWMRGALHSNGAQCLLFLVGGPGAGKSHTSASLVSALTEVSQHQSGLAQRSYTYAALHRNVVVINDASIPPEQRDWQLVDDINAAIDRGDHLIVCVNRGILIEEGVFADEHVTDHGDGVLRWLAGKNSHGFVSELGRAGDPTQGGVFLRTGTLDSWPDETRPVDLAAVYLDVSSLLEPAPSVSDFQASEDLLVDAGLVQITALDERAHLSPESIPGLDFARRVLEAAAVSAGPASLGQDPIAANIASLSSPMVLANLATILRCAEYVGGQYFTYRELWGLLVRAIAGDLPASLGVQSALSQVQQPLPPEGDYKARWEAIRGLGEVRFHQALFNSTGEGTRATRDPVLRLTEPLDPVRDARPGNYDAEEWDSGWATPVLDAFASQSEDNSPLETLLGSLDAAHPFAQAVGEFDRMLDRAYQGLVLLPFGKDVIEASRWYGQYLTRLFGVSLGVPAFRPAINLWSMAASAGYVPDELIDPLRTLLRPRFDPRDSSSPSVLPLFDAKTTPLSNSTATPKLGLRVDDLNFHVEGVNASRLSVRLTENGKDVGLIDLDFPLMREAAACNTNMPGITECTLQASPLLERFRNQRLRPRIIANSPHLVAVERHRMARFGVQS